MNAREGVRFRDAAHRAGYSRDEVVQLGRVFVNPRGGHLRLVEGRADRYTAIAFRNQAARTVHVIGATS